MHQQGPILHAGLYYIKKRKSKVRSCLNMENATREKSDGGASLSGCHSLTSVAMCSGAEAAFALR